MTREFACAPSLLEAVAKSAPDVIFLNLSLEGLDAVEAIRGLDLLGYGGAVQLISGREKKLLNDINCVEKVAPEASSSAEAISAGRGSKTNRRPRPGSIQNHRSASLRGPLPAAVPRLGATGPVPTGLSVRTDEALANNWLEFWYQPIVNIQTGLLEGAELLARVRHPKYECISPAAFLPMRI